MKYLKIVLTMVLLVAFVFATADAAKSSKANTAGTLRIPKALVGKVTPQQWQQMLQEKQERDPDQPYVASPPIAARASKGATLSGDINVGTGNPGYTSIRAAIATLIANGGVGAGGVRFLLTDAVYAETSAVLINGVLGTSAANRLVIQPATGNTSCLVKAPVSNTDNGCFIIKNVNFVRIEGTAVGQPALSRNLTIRFDEAAAAPTNRFAGALRVIQSQSFEVLDCIVLGRFNTAKTLSYDAISTNSGSSRALCLDNFKVYNCVLTHGRYGIDMSSTSPFPSDSNIAIQHNLIGGAFAAAAGISYGDYLDSLTNTGIITGDNMWSDISFNTVDGIRMPAALTLESTTNTRRFAGIFAAFSTNLNLHDNTVRNVYYARTSSTLSTGGRLYGIQLSGNGTAAPGNNAQLPGNNKIYNNVVSEIRTDMVPASGTFYGLTGIFAQFDNNVKIWHNSVWMTGPGPANSYAFCFLAYGNAQDGAMVYYENNAGKNTMTPALTTLGQFCFGTADVNNNLGPSYANENHNDWYYDANGNLSSDGDPLGTWYALTGFGGQSVFGEPNFTSPSNLHLAGASYAYSIGSPLGITTDRDGTARSLTTPSAGAYEPGSAIVDLSVASIAGGYMHGTAQGNPVDLNVMLKNYGSAAANTNLHVTISDGYNKLVAVNVPPMSFLPVTLTGVNSWSPASSGTKVITGSVTLGSDVNAANDTAVNNEYVFPVYPGTKYSTSFEFGDTVGWLGLGDWQLGTPAKLGGPHTGGTAWATQLTGNYNGGNHVVSMLFSPYFDFSNNLHPKVSFWQSIQTEPSWDASVMQFTTDLGASWHVLGQLNDANGQNWYNEATYENAAGNANCFANYQNPPDDGTVFPDPDNPTHTYPKWTSNGDCEGADAPTGPNGYVLNEIIANQLGGKPLVQLRYLANPDASGDDLGWVFDDFEIHPATEVTGTAWNDANNDTFHQNGEPGLAGDTITAVGPNTVQAVTDNNGEYSLILLNGEYTLTASGVPGSVTRPNGGSYTFDVIKNPPIPYTGFDFGYYNPATVSGLVYHDVNHNLSHDFGEPGIGGVTVNVTGAVSASGTTNGSGNYSVAVNISANGNYTVAQVVPAGYIALNPASGSYASVALTPGGAVTGKDFGDGAAAVGQSYRTFSYEDWALAKDASQKYKSIKCKPSRVIFKFNLVVPSGATGLILTKAKAANITVTLGKDKLDTIATASLENGANVSFANHIPAIVAGDTVQVDGVQFPGKKRIVLKYGWAGIDTKANKLVEVYKKNDLKLPMPNLHNVGEEIFAQILQPVYLSGGKLRMVSYKSVQTGMNKSGTLHTSGVECSGLAKQKDALSPAKVQNKLYAELLTLQMNILASDFGKTPPGFGDLIINDGGLFNNKTIRQVLADCDVYFSCADTPEGSDGQVYYDILRQLNHDSFRDSTNADTTFWSCQKISFNGARPLSDVAFLRANPNAVTAPVAMKPLNLYNLPKAYALSQNYPNPFNPSTTIEFALPTDGIVSLKIYNVLGQEIANLLDNVTMDAGVYPVDFDASQLASGIYFYRLTVHGTNDEGTATAQTFSQVKKMLLMK